MNAVAISQERHAGPEFASFLSASANLANMRKSAPMRLGDYLYRADERFSNFYIVRSGSYKCYSVDRCGQEHVTGFRLPGDPLGVTAISAGKYQTNAVALETSTVWTESHDELWRLASADQELRFQMFAMMSRRVAASAILAGDFNAEERMAWFLLELSRNFASRGLSARRFDLSMTRSDIASYLRLAVETVTRVFGRFQERRLIGIRARSVQLIDMPRLQALGACMQAADA